MRRCLVLLLIVCLCVGICACESKSVEAQKADELILAIGEVTLDSESAILATKMYYDTLTDAQKEEVENYSILESAITSLDSLKEIENKYIQICESAAPIIEAAVSTCYEYDYCKVNAVGKTIYIAVATDGFGDLLYKWKNKGYSDSYSLWSDCKNEMIDVCNWIHTYEPFVGIDGIVINVTIRDDENFDRVLLEVSDGVVLYDYMAS